MKDLQKAIEEIKKEFAEKFGIEIGIHEFLSAEAQTNEAVKFMEAWEFFESKLPQLTTSREQEMREEAIKGFVEFNKGRLRTQSFNVEQLKQLYFDDVESALEYLSQQKENK